MYNNTIWHVETNIMQMVFEKADQPSGHCCTMNSSTTTTNDYELITSFV
jgi:hypothetical protein